jgi:hypothetical protein
VTGPRPLARGVAPGADNGVAGVVVDVHVGGLLDPLAQRDIGGKASRLLEGLLQCGQHMWGEREGRASWHVQSQQGVQPPCCIECEPVADGMAGDAQSLGHLQAGLRLPTGQPRAPLESGVLTPVMFLLYTRLEAVRILVDAW